MILEITFAIGFTVSLLCLCLQNIHTQKQIDIIKDEIDYIKFEVYFIDSGGTYLLNKLLKERSKEN